MTTGQALKAVKRMKVTMMTMTTIPQTLGERDVILVLNNSKEDANDKPNATSSDRAITRRSKIDFSSF